MIIGFLVLIFLAGCGQAASVDIGWWTFATDLEGWKVVDYFKPFEMDSSKFLHRDCELRGTWKGITAQAFFYPLYPNAKPTESSGYVDIYVLKVQKISGKRK